ncbi:uncharacterized protein LOC141598425 [Silene latifolia]|uniref:uncharacterized protein LOC141598425 n=1 Tax=Silene latifolia TaxID=37657 RepID=UPI003D787E18
MDESWRMRMGTSNARNSRRGETGLEPEDFEDVFGGPPRSLMARKLSADFSSSEWFYQQVFKDSDTGGPLTQEGQRLPEFRIPEQRRSKTKAKSWMSKSKSTSSSVLSFEELSPFRSPGLITGGEDDVALSTFTSRLRPINVPYRWSSTTTSNMPTSKSKKRDLPAFGSNKSTYIDKNQLKGNEYIINNFIFGFPQALPSPEILVDNHPEPQSPSSALSSHLQDQHAGNLTNFSYEESISYQKQHVKVDDDDHDDDEDEVMSSSYIIELNSHSTEANNSEAIDIDEAIAWAKEQFKG